MVLPLANPKPDYERFLRVLDGKEMPQRPPLIEYIADSTIVQPIVEALGRRWVLPQDGDRASQAAYLDNTIAFWQHMGYDFVHVYTGYHFQGHTLAAQDTASPEGERQRHWNDEHHGMIASWEDFERYPWPKPGDLDLFIFEYVSRHLPDGMGLLVEHSGHQYEWIASLFSYEGLCLMLHDDPALVQAVSDRVGGLLLDFYRQAADFDHVIAFFPGDDMGFRSATLVSPQTLRQYVLPWHARFAELAHAHNQRYYLHSCGNLKAILPDLVETVRIDGKHSFEDAIQPCEEFHRRYAGGQEEGAGLSRRIASLGGVDVDILGRRTPEQVRARTRALIEANAPYGRFAVGSGNSIPNYVPLANYLAMAEEALR